MILVGKTSVKKLDRKFCPKMEREWTRYGFLGFWQYKNYHTI